MQQGCLYLIPTFLAETNDEKCFPPVNLDIIGQLQRFIVEDIRTARRFLRKVGYTRNFDEVVFYELNKHTDPLLVTSFLEPVKSGYDLGLLSEAGIPCVADPGSAVVALAHQMNVRVKPFTGPSSIFLALMASGFNGQNFVFHGYLPIEKKERQQRIRDMERQSLIHTQTQIFIETPYRNNQLLEILLQVCKENTMLCIGSMLTHEKLEFIKTKTIGSWKNNHPDLRKKPTVFLIF